MTNHEYRGLLAGIFLGLTFFVQPGCKGREEDKVEKVKPVVVLVSRPFPLQNVRLLDGPFREAMERNRKYLHELDSDRMLHNFRVNAGLPSSADPLGGWEEPECELRGHFVGHFLTACALTWAAAGDETLRQKADAVVAELAKCQTALGESGYLSAYPEELIDRVIEGKRVWAPWYTLHKIMAGLLDMYALGGNRQALDVLEKMAAWARMRTDKLDVEAIQRMLKIEFGGMNEVLANLYAVTGNPDYLALARRFDHKAVLDPLAGRRDELKGLHANTQIPKLIGAAREYELTGEKYYHDAATYFWDEVVNFRSYSTGGTSNYEGWQSEPGRMASELSNATHETCCTYNMLKLTRQLFGWTGAPKYADCYERGLFNGILPTQDPATGMTMYYVPMGSGWHKTFSTPFDSFWCCTGTGIENHAKYGDSIYFHDDTGLWVNLFIASELRWPEKGLILRQETNFPEEEATTLTLSCRKALDLELRLRVPFWAIKGITIKINGEKQALRTRPRSYITLSRTWKNGDRIRVEMPMSLHLSPMPDDPKLVSLMYGPIVLAGELPTEGLAGKEIYGPYHATGKPVRAPAFVVESTDLKAWIKPLPGRPLSFVTFKAGRPFDVALVPFYRLFGKRYALYWHLYSEKEWGEEEAKAREREAAEAARQRELLRRAVDSIEIGDEVSEKEHKLEQQRSESGYHLGKAWRHAVRAGWFSYELKVLSDQPMILMATYWGSDVGRTFDILVDETKIATQTVNVNKPGDFFDVEYRIPGELTRGKNRVTVRFKAPPDGIAGGVFGLAVLRER